MPPPTPLASVALISQLTHALLVVLDEALADGRPCPACGQWTVDEELPRYVHLSSCALATALDALRDV